MAALRVLIADDNEELRMILLTLLSSEFEVVGSVADGEELVQAATLLYPDVIVSDIGMPHMNGLAARDALLSRGIERPFVFVTMMDYEDIFSALAGGSVGYVHKNDLFSELKLAIGTVAFGNSYISRSFQRYPRGGSRQAPSSNF